MDLSFLVGLLAALFWAVRAQLEARDATAARRNPHILRALSRSELRLVAVGAVNDEAGGGWSANMETTREQRRECAILFGLGSTLAECAVGLDVKLVCDPRAVGRFDVQMFHEVDRDELHYGPGLEHEGMVVLCGEALERAGATYTGEDARALAAELVAGVDSKRNIAQQNS